MNQLQKFYRGKKVFITGHTGFKGSWLTQWLISMGAKVAGYSSYIPSTPSHFETLRLKEQMVDFQGDIRDLEKLSGAIREFEPEILFHLAAQPIVRRSFEERKLTFDTNVGGMVNILEVLLSSSSVKSAVLITSDKCYENVEWEFGYREEDRLGGKDPYSASKACAEIVFSSYARSFFSQNDRCAIATTRAGNVIGGGDWAQDRLIPDIVRAWSRSQEVVLRSPHSTRPWQHVLEPLSGYLWLGVCLSNPENDGFKGTAYNFGPPGNSNASVGMVTQDLAQRWEGRKWRIEEEKDSFKKPEAGLLKLNCDRAQNRLQWFPTLSYEECMTYTADWYRNYYKGESAPTLTQAQIETYEKMGFERNMIWAKRET